MKKHPVSILPAALTLGLMTFAGILLLQGKIVWDWPDAGILILIILILLVQVLILLHREQAAGSSLIFTEIDAKGNPRTIFEFPEAELVRFCRENFAMRFSIEYWPELRNRLLAEKQHDTSDGRLAQRLLDEGFALPDGDFVAYLDYIDRRGRHAMLAGLAQMPTPADGAMEIIRVNFPGTLIFRNARELAAWENRMPEEKKPLFRNQRNSFLKRRAKETA